MSKLFRKKIPTFLALLVLLTAIGGAIFWANKNKLFNLEKKDQITTTPQQIHVTNVFDNQLTVSWLTGQPMVGFIQYGLVNNELDQVVFDSHDEQGAFLVHTVTLNDLEPEKTYYFKIGLGQGDDKTIFDNAGQAYSIKTGVSLKSSSEMRILSGRILASDKSPAQKALVYLAAANMAPLSVLTDETGRWAFFLNQARTKDLTEYAVFDIDATILKIEATDGQQGTQATILTKDAFPSTPDLVLGHGAYDFREGQDPAQFPMEISTVTINNPAEEGEEINSQRPEFFGQGPAGTVLTIRVQSDPYDTTVTIDENSHWSLSLGFDLEPGEHQITISYADGENGLETISRNFVILAAGESDLPAITATTSGDLASPLPLPSPSPQISPSPEIAEPARITQPTNDGQMPVTGTSLPTGILLLAGLVFIFLGLKVLI
jgi:hypothetical protein